MQYVRSDWTKGRRCTPTLSLLMADFLIVSFACFYWQKSDRSDESEKAVPRYPQASQTASAPAEKKTVRSSSSSDYEEKRLSLSDSLGMESADFEVVPIFFQFNAGRLLHDGWLICMWHVTRSGWASGKAKVGALSFVFGKWIAVSSSPSL